jgi:AraC family transcriptional regulator
MYTATASENLHSSQALQWDGLLVEHIQLHADDLYVAPLDGHRICMSLDADFKLEQSRNGTTFVHTFQRGEAQLLPLGTEGMWRYRQHAQVLHIQIADEWMQRVAEETIQRDPAKVEIIDQFLLHDPQVEHIGLALLAELVDGGRNSKLYREALATALAAHLLRKYASVSAADAPPRHMAQPRFQQVLDYIDSHLADDILLAALAQTVNVSPSHFAALFKQQTGVAPYQYILNQRVQRAKELLLRSDLTVAQVAAEVGFYDQSHLTRHMRRMLKITPAALQRQRIVQKPR